MKLENIRKYRKNIWTENYIFGDLCFWFLEKHPHQINRLEKILFLMQHESLTTYEVPLLVHKTYIDQDILYFPQLSELLRMREPDAINDPYYIYIKIKPYHYDKMMKKYEKLKERELNKEIQLLIENDSLNKEYFIFETPSTKKEFRKVRFSSHSFHYMIAGFSGLLCFALGLGLIVEVLCYYGYGLREYNSENLMQTIFFGAIFLGIYINSYLRGTKKPTRYEKNNVITSTSYRTVYSNEESDGLSYDDTISIDTHTIEIDKKQIQTTQDMINVERRMFDDICNMMIEVHKKYVDIDYVITLTRSKQIDLDSEKIIPYYRSEVFIYLARNHVILEAGKESGEWPGAFSELISTKRTSIKANSNYKKELLENIEWYSQVYIGNKDTYVENKEESDNFINGAVFVSWIEG